MQILEAAILSDDLKATEKFYTEILGLRVIQKAPEFLLISCGRSVLRFIKSKGMTPKYHFAFAIPYDSFKDAVTWASIKLALITAENGNVIADFKNWNAKSFYFFDNNGNIVEFIARINKNENLHASFDSSQISSLSEVGIVTDSITVFANQLKTMYKIPVYDKQPLLQNFGALGDDNGLLILSLPGRPWYPTNLPAKKFYTKLKLMQHNEIIELTLNEPATIPDVNL